MIRMAPRKIPEGFTETTLDKVFEEYPDWNIKSESALRKKLKQKKLSVPSKEIVQHIKNSEFRQIRVPPSSRTQVPLLITAPPQSFQIDIAHTGPSTDPYPQVGKNVYYKGLDLPQKGNAKYFLLIVDVLSRKAYAYPMRSRTMPTIIAAYKKFLVEASEGGTKPINSVTGDDEFNKKAFLDLNKKEFILVYTDIAQDDHVSKGHDKLGIVDRCMRTLKVNLEALMEKRKTTNWTALLPEVIADYNDQPHSSLQEEAPEGVYDEPEVSLVQKHTLEQEENRRRRAGKAVFEPGQTVRILNPKKIFDKEQVRWSREVHKVQKLDKNRYLVEGLTRRFPYRDLLPVPADAKDIPLPKNIVETRNKAKSLKKLKATGLTPLPGPTEVDKQVSAALKAFKPKDRSNMTKEERKQLGDILKLKLPPPERSSGSLNGGRGLRARIARQAKPPKVMGLQKTTNPISETERKRLTKLFREKLKAR